MKRPPELRPSLSKQFLSCPLDLHTEMVGLNRAPLWNWIKKHKPRRILEIGLGSGINAKKMIKLAGRCEYFCFDDLSVADLESFEDLRSKPNTKFHIGDTMETLPKYIDSLPKMDLIFIDGAHDCNHVRNDWKYCRKIMHSSTACFFHDYDDAYPDVKEVVDSINEEFNVEVLTPSHPPSFALVRRG